MIKFLRIITIIFLLILNGHSALAIENKILLKVDNKLITSIDILDEKITKLSRSLEIL